MFVPQRSARVSARVRIDSNRSSEVRKMATPADGTSGHETLSEPVPVVATAPPVAKARRGGIKWLVLAVVVVVLLAISVPWIHRALNTVSTDDAYVNGHVTLVAPRVAGQVAGVFVEDNNRVR